MTTDGDELSIFRRSHIGRALARARRTFNDQFEERIRAKGFEDFRPSDVTVIARLPVGGSRTTDLAERAGITKQAAGKLIKGLEERGYVTRTVDPDDGRAQQVQLTRRGTAFLEAARHEVAAIEDEWSEVLGAAGLTRLRRALLQVSDAFGPPEFL